MCDQDVKERDEASGCPEVEATARLLREILNGMVTGIRFTSETKEQDFAMEWGLPTLDTQWKVEESVDGGKRKLNFSSRNQ